MNMSHNVIRSGVLVAALSACLVSAPAHARVVGDGQLENYCAQEAMARLNVPRGKITTLPTELLKGRFHVNGEVMTGSGLVTFECVFNKRRVMQGFRSNGDAETAAPAPAPARAGGAPPAAVEKCLYTFGVPARIKMVSPLKPGYYEIILRAKDGSRQVACTVPGTGAVIEDWVEMKP